MMTADNHSICPEYVSNAFAFVHPRSRKCREGMVWGSCPGILRYTVAAFLFSVLVACGGGGGGDGDDSSAPTASILFPPPQSRTDASELTVTGIAGDEGTIASVRVNGIDATTSDGFATWRATVPLAPGVNELIVETADDSASRNFDTDAARVTVVNEPGSDPRFTSALLQAAAFDKHANQVYVYAQNTNLWRIDMNTGAQILFVGGIIAFGDIQDMVIDQAGNRLLVIARVTFPSLTNYRVVGVDLDTAALDFAISGIDIGSGGDFSGSLPPPAIELDPDRERLLVARDIALDDVMQVDLDSGDRTLLSGPQTFGGPGIGTNFRDLEGLALDPANNRLLTMGRKTGAPELIEVDLETRDRNVLSDILTPGPAWDETVGHIALDEARNRVLVVRNLNEIVDFPGIGAIDLASGRRSIVSDGNNGNGTDFLSPGTIALDVTRGVALVPDGGLSALVVVELISGDRVILSP